MPSAIAVLALDPAPMFEVAVPSEIWGLDRSRDGAPTWEFRIVGLTKKPIATTSGFSINPTHGPDGLDDADLIVLPGWMATWHSAPPKKAIDLVIDAHKRGVRLASYCSGAFVLAAAGLLDGKRATTHWKYTAGLATHFPSIEVDPDVLYVDEDPLFTSAGTAAAIDLSMHLTRKDHGSNVANLIARRMVMPPHRDGGQAQYIDSPIQVTEDDPISLATTWAARRLQHELTVDDLARRARMSPRNFARRFRSSTGTTPLQWLLVQRVREAQRLLETTTMSVDEIASRTGLGTAPNLRIHFTRIVGTTPTAYRSTFRRSA